MKTLMIIAALAMTAPSLAYADVECDNKPAIEKNDKGDDVNRTQALLKGKKQNNKQDKGKQNKEG